MPIISTAERPWSSQHQRELKVLLLSFYQKVQHSTFGSRWMDGHLGKYESISTNLNVLPIYFLLSAISKNLVVAALKGKTSMVLSPQNWQLDTPEGKDWYINAVERRWWIRMLSENQCPLSQYVFVIVFFFDKFEYNIIFTSPNRNNFCVKVDSQLIIINL